MSGSKYTVAMTGATGLLGRNLLFELIRRHRQKLDELEIIVLGRGEGPGTSLWPRLRRILISDGFSYMSVPVEERRELLAQLAGVIRCVDLDLGDGDAVVRAGQLEKFRGHSIDCFFHLAGVTDFRSTPEAACTLQRVNVEGTRRVLESVSRLGVGEFCYVSTAYVCGDAEGRIYPSVLNEAARFRNAYERSKFEAELMVRSFGTRTGTRIRIFRPSTICGRLQEHPLGATCKFDVFYAWAAFFLRLKQKLAAEPGAAEPGRLDVRICYSTSSGLNIVPVDYAARVMCAVCEQNDPGESYHLVNDAETPHAWYIAEMLRTVGVTGVRHVQEIPETPNRQERLYYKSVGAFYTPYITCPEMRFDTASVEMVQTREGLQCPSIGPREFAVLMAYAREQNFGLRENLHAGIPCSPPKIPALAARNMASGSLIRQARALSNPF